MDTTLKVFRYIGEKPVLLIESNLSLIMEDGFVFKLEGDHIGVYGDVGQILITDFEYTAQRMGGAPYITTKIKSFKCIDSIFDSNVFVEFLKERYFIRNSPSSSKDNTDARYVYEIDFYSEREILNHVYFIDTVQGDSTEDHQKSNTATVQFFGDINEFASRLNSCFAYLGIDYNAVVDEGITSDAQLVSFEDKYIMSALQTSFETFDIPYYFDGKTVHFGYKKNAISYPMKYGFNEALLSISKENANYAIINKIKGIGSSDNIPYYYPNKSPKGDIGVQVPETNVSLKDADLEVFNDEKFSEVSLSDSFVYKKVKNASLASIKNTKIMVGTSDKWNGHYLEEGRTMIAGFTGNEGTTKRFLIIVNVSKPCYLYLNFTPRVTPVNNMLIVTPSYSYDNWTEGTFVEAGTKEIYVNLYIGVVSTILNASNRVKIAVSYNPELSQHLAWTLNEKEVSLENYGVRLSDSATVSEGDSFSQKMGVLIPSVENLMPSIYRESLGKEQFYEAKNNTYYDGEGGYYEFENEYSENNQRQGTTEFEDIKPTIVGMTNASGQRMDKFIDFAFDENDNDEIDTDGNYVHPYFFAKLPKYNGENGFNLFDHASESGNMTISMTSGTCGACSFEIGVGEKSNQNTVQVDEHGNLLKDENGDIRCGRDGKPAEEPQPRQQDTENYEVWIALKKDDSTYTNIMPNAYHNLKPSTDDTFVILNINLPDAYIYNAEKKLEQALIKYMWENNREKINFSIKFSRIFFTEHPEILEQLDENSTIVIEYNGQQHSLYVDSFTYKMSSDETLPEIEVTLVDTIAVSQNSLQNQVADITYDILYGQGGSGDFLKQGIKYFLRKDVEDVAQKRITFEQGVRTDNVESKNFTSGTLGSGHKLFTDPDTGQSYCEIDRLYVRMKAYFDSLEIKEVSHIGGELILTPASMKCSRVEVIEDGSQTIYRCYMNADDGEESVQNQFVVGDYAYCKQFNIQEGIYENVSNRYYWYEVIAVGVDYIDVEKGRCDTDSDIPQAGDNIVSLGNTSDPFRQNAIVLSTVGINAPSKTLYQGINGYSLSGKAIIEEGFDTESNQAYTKIYGKAYIGAKDESSYISFDPTTNKMKIRAEVEITSGSGFGNLTDKPDIDAINQSIENAQDAANAANADLTNFKSDSKISPVEKTALKQQLADINSEYSQIISNANKYSISTTSYTSAYNSAKTALTKYTATSPEFISIGSDYNNISAYYTARQTILDTIATKAKEYADSIGDSAKDDVARKMGYSSYADMVAKAEAGSTIIKGGKINTELIETENLKISGSIFTPLFRITSSNFNNYVSSKGSYNEVNIGSTGFNVQFEYYDSSVSPLPLYPIVTKDLLGCNVKIFNYTTNSIPVRYGIRNRSSTGTILTMAYNNLLSGGYIEMILIQKGKYSSSLPDKNQFTYILTSYIGLESDI